MGRMRPAATVHKGGVRFANLGSFSPHLLEFLDLLPYNFGYGEDDPQDGEKTQTAREPAGTTGSRRP